MNPFRSVGARLSLALLLVVAGALLIAYLFVVPSLEHRLTNTKLSQLERASHKLKQGYSAAPGFAVQDFVDSAAVATNAHVVLLGPLGAGALNDEADSMQSRYGETGIESDRFALRARETGALQRGTVERHDESFAEVAIPLGGGSVLLLSASLAPQVETVDALQQRLLIAGLVALAVALALGYGGSWVFARRIRRLERAADRIAGGWFDEPIVDRNQDELGELARAFDRMRTQLSHLDNARREFIANASHELRTPLFSLGGFLELMADEDLDDETRQEFLATMRDQVARLTKLATELLDLSRLDAGQIRVERRPLDLVPLALAVSDEFSAIAKATDHRLDVASRGSAPAVADPERVLQIGRALVENALVHTPAGTLVRIRAERKDGHAVLAVEDEGPGIPAGQVEQVFERFYRADGGRTSGSGLGLAIARELAGLMEGRIELDSRPGRTVFSLVLPSSSVRPPTGGQFSRERSPRAPAARSAGTES